MIVLFLHVDDAEDLLNLCRQRGFAVITKQIDAQIAVERAMPNSVLPVLSVRYGDEANGIDVFEDGLAQAMYQAMQEGAERHRQRERDEMPLFAEIGSDSTGRTATA